MSKPDTHTPPPSPPSSAAGLKRYRRHAHHLRKAKWHLVGGIVSGAVFAITTGAALPVAIKYLLPIFFNQTDKIDPDVAAFARRLFGEDYTDRLLLLACIGLPLVFVVRGVAAIANKYLTNQSGFIVLESLRMEVYDRLLGLPLAFYQRNTAGDLMSRLLGDTDKLKNVVVTISGEIIKQPLTLVASFGALIYLCVTQRSALFALIAMLSVPLCIIPIRMAARRLVKRSRQLAEQSGKLGSGAIETLQSPLEIQAYNLQTRQRDRFAANIADIFKLSMKTVKYQAVVTPVIEIISVCGFVAALYFGTRNGMTYDTFFALATALYMSYEPVKKLSGIHAIIKTGEASLDRLEYVLDAVDTVPQPAAPRALPTGPLPLAFEQVRFAYPARGDGSANRAALENVTLRIQPGETVALVGKTGAGKSTFITLIPRFYDVDSGRVTLGGIDLRELDKQALREHIAVVPQQPLLFNTTFAENIRLGRPGASDDEVEQAARRACIHDFIASLPDGYATVVGERGSSLSGGQRQRIAIARAFLKDAPFLILDEATSALDSESEAMIQQALGELIRGRTTFMIAHRFSSIRHATRILVFTDGRIAADGSHAELYASSPIYQDLYNHQMLAGTSPS
ncbi:MAG: ABC transporter ATP-binding protein [Burkholderiales bacterium]|nr:ABC transporter ATP-binding protein [Opitutaceae bacterium]